MTRGTARQQFDSDVAALNDLWNEWDPIGVTDAVDDEYESQAITTLSRLQAGATEDALASELASLLEEYVGIEPGGHEEFARRLVDWWHHDRKLIASKDQTPPRKT